MPHPLARGASQRLRVAACDGDEKEVLAGGRLLHDEGSCCSSSSFILVPRFDVGVGVAGVGVVVVEGVRGG